MPNKFKIIKGEQYRVCRRFHNMLARYPDLAEVMLPNKFPLDDQEEGFRLINWEDIDPQDHPKLVAHLWGMHRYNLIARKAKVSIEEYVNRVDELDPAFREKLEANEFKLQRTFVDANFDGEKNILYRFGFYSGIKELRSPDEPYLYDLYMAPLFDNNLTAYPSYKFLAVRDAFLHEGRIYLVGGAGPYRLRLSETSKGRRILGVQRPVCRFESIVESSIKSK